MVLSIEAECSDVEIIFMHPKGSDEFSSNKSFRWPIREDRCFVLFEHLLCIMNNYPQTRTGRLHSFSQEDISRASQQFEERF